MSLLPACRAEPTPSPTGSDGPGEEADDDDDNADGDDTAASGVPLDWGTTEACEEWIPTGFDPFYDADGDFIIVHGPGEAEAALAERVRGWYRSALPGLQVREASALSDEERQQNLFLVGAAPTHPLLQELNGSLPVWFEEERFTFGGYRYEEPGHGIAMVHPSPLASGRYLLLYTGNTIEGAFSTFTIWTGGEGYHSTRGRGVLQQEGAFCGDGEMWRFSADRTTDLRADWESWKAGLEVLETDHHVLLAEPGSEAAVSLEDIGRYQDEAYEHLLSVLEVEALDTPIHWYLYPSNAQKGEITGVSGNGHANDLNLEVHAVYGDGVHAIGAHEDVHVVAWYRIGEAHTALMGEGLAVMTDGEWWGEPLGTWASRFAEDDEIPPLDALISDFWSHDDTLTYPLAGHFVAFLAEEAGMDAVKAIYVAEDLEAAFIEELGMDTAEVEALWLASIE